MAEIKKKCGWETGRYRQHSFVSPKNVGSNARLCVSEHFFFRSVCDGMRRNVLMLFTSKTVVGRKQTTLSQLPTQHTWRFSVWCVVRSWMMGESENASSGLCSEARECACVRACVCIPKGVYVDTRRVVKRRKECSIAAVLGSMLPFTVWEEFRQE